MNRPMLTVVCMVVVCGGLLAPAATVQSESSRGSFTYHESLLFIDCQVNQVAALCLIDTGANVSAIDDDFAAQLGLADLRKTEVLGTAGSVAATMVKVNSLTIHNVESTALEMTKRDIQHGSTPGGRRLDVIVGFDFLRQRVMKVDYSAQQIVFEKDAPVCKAWVEMKLEEGIPQVAANLNDSTATRLRIDTGASLFKSEDTYINIVIDDLDKLLAAEPNLKPKGSVSSTGVGGELSLPIYELRALRIGDIAIPRPRAIVQAKQGYFARPNAVGFFGNNVLERLSPVVFDYGSGRLGLECSNDATTPSDNSGR